MNSPITQLTQVLQQSTFNYHIITSVVLLIIKTKFSQFLRVLEYLII